MLVKKFAQVGSIVIASILAFVLMAFMLAGCSAPAAKDEAKTDSPSTASTIKLIEDGKLIVGSDCDYPPFIELSEAGKPAGFEYDFLQAVAEKLGLELQYLPPQNFDSILASVAAGTSMDLGVSSFTITPERQELVDFATPYFDSNQAVVALKASGYTSVEDLANLTLGAQSGTTGAEWALENIPGAASNLKNFTQTSEALVALQAGEVQAVIFDQPVAAEQVATTFSDAQIIQEIPTGEQYGMAVSKDNPQLKDKIDAAIKDLIADGTYARIFAEYFDFEPTITAS